MPTRKKIGLIGAGNIGGELARLFASEELGDVFLYDVPAKENYAKGKALDLEQNGAVLGYDSRIHGTGSWADLEGADVLVITAGIPRKPGQSRDDLVASNLPIIRDVAQNAKKVCPNAFVIVISNPLDAMVYEYKRVVGAPKHLVVGMAGVLDSGRFQLFLAREAGVSVKDVRAMVLGGHGDDMVPVLSMTTVNGIPVSSLIAKDKLDKIIERTRKGGGEIVNLMGTSAYYAPGLQRRLHGQGLPARRKAAPPLRVVPGRRVRLHGPLHGRSHRHRRQGRGEDHRYPSFRGREGHARQERQERARGRGSLQEGVERGARLSKNLALGPAERDPRR